MFVDVENIKIAKDELYDAIKEYSGVVGTSVRKKDGMYYIVVLLSRLTSKAKSIPANFKGNKVEFEVIGKINSI
ncbi:MAG: hypothetical protein E6H09_10555 [Bacteroidetes bacterium]|jgi:hypothetical protein|nr:MAG: hypothetical protein E6H09_10555 [Bacteroidota bacterium]